MNDKRKLTVSIILLVLLLLGLTACQNQEPEATPTAEAGAETSTLEETNRSAVGGIGTVSAEGTIKPLRNADLSFQTGGTVAEILTAEGAVVNAGDPLVRLDAVPLENAVRQAEAGQAAAEASLQAAQARLAVAQSGIARAEAGKKAAEAQLALAESGATPEEIAAAEKNLAAAEAAIVEAAGNRDAAVNVSSAAVQAAQAQVTSAQAQVDSLQQTYDDIIEACFELPDGSEVCPLYGPVEENTRVQLEAAKANLEAARLAESEARAGATPAEAQLANTGVLVASAFRDQAEAQLNLVKAGPREEQIQQAQVGVEQAEVGVQQATDQVTQAEASVTQAEANLVKAQADVEAARKGLDRMILKAPFAGRVASVTAEVGELVPPNLPVVQLGDFGSWQVETTDLTELDVVGVKLGLPVRVTVDALPGEELSGVVTDISAVSSLVRGDVTYPETITQDDTNLPLRWGMTAFVDIETES
jgi:HlyD family secretion protein